MCLLPTRVTHTASCCHRMSAPEFRGRKRARVPLSRKPSAPGSAYVGPCSACVQARTCAACVSTAVYSKCTAAARSSHLQVASVRDACGCHLLRLTNHFLDEVVPDYMFSFVLVVWEAAPAEAILVMQPLDLTRPEASDPAHLLRVRRCSACGKYRMFPRYQSEPVGSFVCEQLADVHFASCAAPCPICQ